MSNLLKQLSPTKHSFRIDVAGDLTKAKYQGNFECKILNRGERALVSKHRAFLNGDVESNLDIATLNFHYMISFLKYSLTSVPDFWRDSDYGYAIYDENVIKEVFDEVIKFEENWLKEIWGDEFSKLQEKE